MSVDWLPFLAGGLAGVLTGGTLYAALSKRRSVTPPTPGAPEQGKMPPWRDFVEISSDWLWQLDADMRFMALPDTPVAPSIAPHNHVGRSWEEVVLPELPSDFIDAHVETLSRRGPIAVTLHRPVAGGTVRQLEMRGRPVFDAQGRFQGYRGIGREVTENMRLADELRRSEERIHALLAYSADAYWEQDPDLRYTVVTTRSGRLGDIAAEELIGQFRWDQAGAAVDTPPWTDHIAQLRQIEPFTDFIFSRTDREGQRQWLAESGIPVFDHKGVFAGYCGITRNITETLDTRSSLEARVRQLMDSFDAAPMAMALLSAEGFVVEANAALATLLGLPVASLRGSPIEQRLTPDDAEAGAALRARCLSGESGGFEREVRYRRADGSEVWCREMTAPVPHPGADTLHFVMLLDDVTTRRTIQEDQRAGEKRFRLIFEATPEALLICQGGNIHLANDSAARLFGSPTADGLRGIEMLSLVHPDERAMEAARLEHFDLDPQQTTLPPLPLRYRRMDGSILHAEATAIRLRFDGKPAVLFSLRDVARWLSAEQVLRESRAMYRDVVESVNEILFQTDAEGRLTFLNRAWRNISGFDGRLSIGQKLSEFVIEADRNRVEQGLQSIFQGYLGSTQFEFRLRTQSDGPRWVEATLRPLRDTADHIIGSSGTLDDITARKLTEQSQQDLNRELEARVRGRTAELEASNRELEAFSYSVSHDLRAPLRAIDGFAQIVAEDYAPQLDENGKDYLFRIRAATQRMARLIDDLIDLARLTRQTMNREPVNLSSMVEQILADLCQEEPERVVDIHVEGKLFAAVDRALIRVALDNLLRNAWKFTSRREVAQIRFHAEQRDRQIVYCVSDNGAGFDMSFASKLFLPFHRLHGISEFAGTGIGLATVQRIIQRHEGRVWAESAPDRGASFYFTLGH